MKGFGEEEKVKKKKLKKAISQNHHLINLAINYIRKAKLKRHLNIINIVLNKDLMTLKFFQIMG